MQPTFQAGYLDAQCVQTIGIASMTHHSGATTTQTNFHIYELPICAALANTNHHLPKRARRFLKVVLGQATSYLTGTCHPAFSKPNDPIYFDMVSSPQCLHINNFFP